MWSSADPISVYAKIVSNSTTKVGRTKNERFTHCLQFPRVPGVYTEVYRWRRKVKRGTHVKSGKPEEKTGVRVHLSERRDRNEDSFMPPTSCDLAAAARKSHHRLKSAKAQEWYLFQNI